MQPKINGVKTISVNGQLRKSKSEDSLTNLNIDIKQENNSDSGCENIETESKIEIESPKPHENSFNIKQEHPKHSEPSNKKIKTETTNHKRESETKSRHHNSEHRSRSDRDRESRRCSHCKRRKTKYVNFGVQCRRDHDLSNKHLRRLSPSAKLLPSGNMTNPIDKNLKYRRYMHIETHCNGGATLVHMYQKQIQHLSKEQMKELATEFFKVAFEEDDNGYATHVMAIVHGAASYLPDLLEYMALHHPSLIVKSGVLGRGSDIDTCTFAQYQEQVHKHYQNGTVRYGPLHQVSLAGIAHEEVGGYFPDLLDKLEENPFLDMVSSYYIFF